MLVATKTTARTAVNLILNPMLVAEAKAEFEAHRAGERYVSFVGDNPPPLDYRGGGD
jgi:aminobenzoyl-glutamate utilization protein B